MTACVVCLGRGWVLVRDTLGLCPACCGTWKDPFA